MRVSPAVEFPPEEAKALEKAHRLEIVTIIFLLCAATTLFFTMGSSQAMRTGFFDDLLSTFPAVAFLISARVAHRAPSREYPYGFHSAVSVGFISASLALSAVGLLLLIEALQKFIHMERTTIGGMELFGRTVWAGWPMLAAVAVTSVPAVFLGRAKHELAPKIRDKVLYADADMMKADWMVGLATAAGVIGVGLGFWWADPLAAALVSFDIITDGFSNLRVAVSDVVQRRPMKTDRSGLEPLPWALRDHVRSLPWVETAEVRVRESGHVFFGEVFVQPQPDADDLPVRVRELIAEAKHLNWRMHDLTVTVVDDLSRLDD